MLAKNKIIAGLIQLTVCVVCLAPSPGAFAACIGSVPVWGTGDDRSSCAYKQKLKKEEQRLNIEQKEKELALKRRGIHNNRGTGSGNGNTNVILGGLSDMINGKNDPASDGARVMLTRHQVRVELMPYVIPGAYQFDEPGMPEKFFFNGAAWEYYVNKNLGFGVLWQEWSKTGARDFEPVTNGKPDASGDYHETPVHFPGGVDRIKYTLYMPYVTINAELGSPLWNAVFRAGVGRTKAEIEYKDIDLHRYPFADQPSDTTYTDNTSIMFDIAVERWTYGTKIGGAIRYVNARHDTSDYLDYINMGGAQILFYVQFMLQPLGLL